MNHILANGRVGRKLKEMIFVAISSLKTDRYCEAAHHAFCLNIGVYKEQLERLIKHYQIGSGDPMEKSAIDFVVRSTKDSHASSKQDLPKYSRIVSCLFTSRA